jgi:hypothetical protein
MIGICNTDGSGLWSECSRPVKIIGMDIAYLDDESLVTATFGELRVYFDTDSWDTDLHGLIYTDKQWIREFQNLLVRSGFSHRAAEGVYYSEQGMQGHDYVSLDIADTFFIECDKLMNFVRGGSLKIAIGLSALE